MIALIRIIQLAILLLLVIHSLDRYFCYGFNNAYKKNFISPRHSISNQRSAWSSCCYGSSLVATRRPSYEDDGQRRMRIMSSRDNNNDKNVFSELVTSRLPTSVDDQVRQAAEAMKRATADGVHRHVIRLLLPVIGATELDDWPGGSRQQMEAANPLVQDILRRIMNNNNNNNNNKNKEGEDVNSQLSIRTMLIDESDGVAALFTQGSTPMDDSCTVLLPTADTITDTVQNKLEEQVGTKRNLILVNPQYRRRSDFGGIGTSSSFFPFIGGDDNSKKTAKSIEYIEQYIPTFSLTNFICDGESIRVIRAYPGPWRVYRQTGLIRQPENNYNNNDNNIDWIQIGTKDVINKKPNSWDNIPENQRDGGLLYNYGQPSYQEIQSMIINTPNYKPKNPAERAAAAFNFIKDTL